MLALLMGAGVPPAALLAVSGTHMVMIPGAVHLVVVGTAGLLAATAAVVMSIVSARRNDGRTLWLGMSFSVMAGMLVIHALTTPGEIEGPNGVVQVAGVLNLPIGGTLLAAIALPIWRRPPNVRLLLRAQFAIVAALVVIGAILLDMADRIAAVPAPSSLAATLIFIAGAIPLLYLAGRAARTYLLTQRPLDVVVAAGVVWLIGAQYGLLEYGGMEAAFWAAHVLEVAGIGMIGIPAALDLRHAVGSRPLLGDLRAADLVAHEETFLGGRIRALLTLLGDKDPSTEGHTRRVAALAVEIGEQLGLHESHLRQLALGGLLHDMGKLSVPNAILNKPGRLTDEEFAEIRRHPGAGRELLAEIGGFSPLVLELVESHHERLDGGGYPNALPAGALDVAVRILTVADVYDALTADRVYREAWPMERALALLEHDSGSAFDPACVAALQAVLDRRQRDAPKIPTVVPRLADLLLPAVA
jgi:HD-GYP domain-containing protein (c-di-GMP phosphodiesterase class II)